MRLLNIPKYNHPDQTMIYYMTERFNRWIAGVVLAQIFALAPYKCPLGIVSTTTE